jgi:hypothetical protein
VAAQLNRHVAVSVGGFPCYRPQTPSLDDRKGPAVPCPPLCVAGSRPHQVRLRFFRKRWRGSLGSQRIGRRWCHAAMGWVEASWTGAKRCGSRTSRCRGPISVAGGVSAKACLSNALDLRIGLPTGSPPAAARQIPTVSLSLPSTAIETSFSLSFGFPTVP